MAYQHDKHNKGVMRSHWKRQPFVLTLKNATCPRKICQNTKFCAKFVKFTPGKILQKKICLWVMTNIRYVKDNQGDSLNSPPLSLVE